MYSGSLGHISLSAQPHIEGSRDAARCDVVTQCRFARHMVALQVSDPGAERISSQEKSDFAVVMSSSLCCGLDIVQQTLRNNFLREAMPWTIKQTKQSEQ